MTDRSIRKTVREELRFLFQWSWPLHGAVWLITLPFLGLNFAVPLGLLLGTAVMLLNLFLVGRSMEDNLRRFGHVAKPDENRSLKFAAVGGYLIRYLIAAGALSLTLIPPFSGWIHTLGVLAPMFYPRIIYGVKLWRNRQNDKRRAV